MTDIGPGMAGQAGQPGLDGVESLGDRGEAARRDNAFGDAKPFVRLLRRGPHHDKGRGEEAEADQL